MKALLAALLAVSSAAQAEEQPKHEIPAYCAGSDNHKISVPVDPSQPGTQKFDFSFQWVERGGPDAPTIIYFPGGPGGSAIADWGNPLNDPRWESMGFPKSGVNVLFLDPRGVGCNDLDESVLPDDSLSTAAIVSDALAAVRSLGITRYFVYGISYGTMPATVFSYRAEHGEAKTGPIALLIGGVIGKASVGNPLLNSVGQSIRQWENFKQSLPPKAVEQLCLQEHHPGIRLAEG